MADLTPAELQAIYASASLTPVLICLGGNRSYNHGDTTIADWYGYHLEETQRMVTLHEDAENRLISFPVSTIQHSLEGKWIPEFAVYTVDNWLWHTSVFTQEPQYSNIKQQIIDFIQADDEDIYGYYALVAIKYLKQWRMDDNDRLKERGIRHALSVKYYLQYGTLNCDYQALQTEYNIDTNQKIRDLVIEGRTIILNAFAEKFFP